jgi:hypothetical protein
LADRFAKIQTPITKPQRITKLQITKTAKRMNFKEGDKASDGDRLELGNWSFSGAWVLGFGAFGRYRLSD